jgi:hypothetical protein
MATKRDIKDQLSALSALIANAPAGLVIDDIAGQSRLDLDRRTLQRRLEALVDEGRIVRLGKGPGTRYQPTAAGAARQLPGLPQIVPVSPRAAQVQAYLRKPPQARKIVAYDRGFLERSKAIICMLSAGRMSRHWKLEPMPRTSSAAC